MDEKIITATLKESAGRVFADLVQMDISPLKVSQDKAPLTEEHLTAMVGFTGVYMGIAAIHCTMNMARKIAGSMLMTDPSGFSAEEIRDGLGEVANQLSGRFKSQFAINMDLGDVVFDQTVPSVISGDNFEAQAVTDAKSYYYDFETEHGSFTVEVALKKM